jgi:hypothetical protein
MNLKPHRFDCWFSVSTRHGAKLEFVLRDAEDRLHLDAGYCGDALWSMMNEALGNANVGEIIERTSYGTEEFLVCAPTPGDLQLALAICSTTVEDWKRVYRVEEMK